MGFIDTHCHLDHADFAHDLENVLKLAKIAGIERIVSIGAGFGGLASADRAIQLAAKYPEVFAAVGVHPNDASTLFNDEHKEMLAGYAKGHVKVVAVGETGLDFYRDYATPKAQEDWFRFHIELALEVSKPVVIHCRDQDGSRSAFDRTIKILREYQGVKLRGVFHSFAGTYDMAEEVFELGFLISFNGVITFKNAVERREVVRSTPLNRMLLETDAPYLAPVPHRGARCDSSMVPLIAEVVARQKGVSIEEVAEITTKNAHDLFFI